MSQPIVARPFAYNPSPNPIISGTIQIGDLAVGTPTSGLTNNPLFWNGPNEDLGYVIAYPVPAGDHPTPIFGVFSSVGFLGTKNMPNPLNESTFVELTNNSFNQSFTNGNDASTWLTNNGYWNSWVSTTPTPTATLGLTPTPTPTGTSLVTPTPTPTPTGTSSTPSGSQYYFFVTEGQPALPPSSSGNTEFFYTSGTLATYNPNYTGGTFQIYFNRYSSNGIDNLTAQQGLDTTGGTITMTQGANTVVYTGTSGDYSVVSNFFYLQVTGTSQQSVTSSGMFVSGSPIYVSFGTPAPTPTPSATSVTPTPTPTSGASGNFNVLISQQGPDVVWSGAGSFNLTNLTLDSSSTISAGYAATQAIWAAGPSATVPTDQWSGPSFTVYPTSFGAGGSGAIGASSGSIFGILPGGFGRLLIVPSGYASGSFISGSTTYSNTTISGMGLNSGTYTWSWGTGGNVSTMVMTIQ